MSQDLGSSGALAISAAIRAGKTTATEVAKDALARIQAFDGTLNCFTEVLANRALDEARKVDAALARGEDPGPLAGVPFAVKNLLDIEGLPTLAGSVIRADAPAPQHDAASVCALRRAGAVLVGALNMDEFAYGFTTENSHYGATRNPHDLTRVAGGSSGGSAAAVAAGLVPLTLGSDTNGSIRVPSAFCGVFGLKPTYGRVSRRGAFLFVGSLDHIGPFARSAEDLAAAFDAIHGPDLLDPVCSTHPPEPCTLQLRLGQQDLRIGIAGGYFQKQGEPAVFEAVSAVANALGADRTIELPEAARARAAAYIITASEGGNHHLADLKKRAADFDPHTRSRFLAGTLVPAAWVSFAQRFRSWYRDRMREVFRDVDVILAPATPCPAIRIGQETIVLDGKEIPARPNIGIFSQPISFVGLPVVTVPVHLPGSMPLGVQLIGAPYQEAALLRVAWELQARGIVSAAVPEAFRTIPAGVLA
ncbi:MAG: 1-carboxybiuret hydrolase [Bryobacterales bacterium]|jgi:AtzE family amidohydrolase|nr:1-carboxybiuret hydrolase [Bryobacterales bacterium]